jgi:autoinducer 2-degrading protein
MIVTCVYILVKPEWIDDFVKSTEENHRASIVEEGNLRFDFLRMADDQSSFMLYEAYVSEAAAARHKTTPHYLKWKADVDKMMAEPRKGVKYNILKPEAF